VARTVHSWGCVAEIEAFGKVLEGESSIGKSRFGESRILRTYVFRHWKVRNPDRRYDRGNIREGRVNHESIPEG
jgi:hypothetical protein